MKRHIVTFDRFIRIATFFVGAVLVFLLLRRLRTVLLPFLVAWLVAYMLYPIVRFVQFKCRVRNRILAIIITLLGIAAILTGACVIVLPPIFEEIARLKSIILNYITTDSTITSFTTEVERIVKERIQSEDIVNTLTVTDVSQVFERYLPQLLNLIGSSVSFVVTIVSWFISILYLFFILSDYETISQGFFKLVPPAQRHIVHAVTSDVERGMNSYFRGQSLIALCVGILFSIGFLIIDFPLAIPLGLFIGFLNLVPYLQTVGFLPTIVLALLKAHDTGDSFWSILLAALIVFAVVQVIQDSILVPRIMGHVTGLNAAVILLSLSVWGSLLGLVGLIIALPLTTIILSYYKRFVLAERAEESQSPSDSTLQPAAETVTTTDPVAPDTVTYTSDTQE